MPIRFSGALTKKDVYRAFFHLSMPSMAFGGLLTLVGGFLILTFDRGSAAAIAAMPFSGLLLMGSPFWQARRNLSSDRTLLLPWEGEADDQGLRTQSQRGTSNLECDLCAQAYLTRDLVMLRLKLGIIQIFPRASFLTDQDWNTFQELVRLKVKKRMNPLIKAGLIWLSVVAGAAILIWAFAGKG